MRYRKHHNFEWTKHFRGRFCKECNITAVGPDAFYDILEFMQKRRSKSKSCLWLCYFWSYCIPHMNLCLIWTATTSFTHQTSFYYSPYKVEVNPCFTCNCLHGRGNWQRKAFSAIPEIFKQGLFSVCSDKQTAGKHWFRINRGTGPRIPTIVHFHFEKPCRHNLQLRVEPWLVPQRPCENYSNISPFLNGCFDNCSNGIMACQHKGKVL